MFIGLSVADEWFYGPLEDIRSGYVLMDANGLVEANDITLDNPSSVYALNHDSFTGFVANEHLDWTADLGATNIDSNNISWADSETALEAVLDLQDLQGAVTDGQVPNTITIDRATLATTLTITDDENSNDDQEVLFTTDNANVESDGDFTYNPSQGELDVNSIVIGGAGHHVDINDYGVVLYGNARVTKEFNITAVDFSPGASGPTSTRIGNYPGYGFTINDDMYASFEVPDDWDTSSDIHIVVYWAINEAYGATQQEVQWYCDWTATPSDSSEALDAPTHTGAIDFGDQSIPAIAKSLETVEGSILAASLAAGDFIGLHGSRVAVDDGNDPAAEPVIIDIEVYYTANRLGEAL